MSQQRAEQRLGTQLAALQVLGRGLGGAMGGKWLWAGPCACVGRASDPKASDLTPGGGGDQAPEHSGVRSLQVLDITWILSKKHLELAEAKFTMQAENLRQVRTVLGSEGRTRGEGMSW